MPVLELSVEGGETSLSVRRFSVHEAVSSLFTVSVWARAENTSIDLEGIVGKQAFAAHRERAGLRAQQFAQAKKNGDVSKEKP